MKNFKVLFALFLLVSTPSLAQDFYYEDYDWDKEPILGALTEKEQQLDEVVIKKKQSLQMLVFQDQPVEYRLNHVLITLNTDAGIERHNKWYVYNSSAIQINLLKARVIKPNGEIVIQSADDIQEAKNEDGDVEYRYFAFEGIEKGSTIEFLELALYPANLTGGTFNIESSSHRKKYELEIISPDYLVYQTHSINGAAEMELDTTAKEGHRRKFLIMKDVEPSIEEDWSTYEANLKKVYYKLNRNINANKANFYTYNNVTRIIHGNIFGDIEKKEQKLVSKFLKGIELDGLETEDKIRAIENELKRNYYIIDQYFDGIDNIELILKNKVMNDDGFYKLFVNCLRELEIPVQLVVTCDRYENKFIEEYEAYNFLQEYMLFFPKQDKYLSHDLFYRYGFVPYGLTSQKALFIREVRIQDMSTGVGEIKTVEPINEELSIDKMDIALSIDLENTRSEIDVNRICTGYKAQPYQVALDYMIDEEREKLKDEYIKYVDDEATVNSREFENDATDLFGKEPLIGKGKIVSTNFIERGGDKLLLKAGMLIGPQSELYNRDERVSPIESPYPRIYQRTIKIMIPEGYNARNPEDFNMKVIPFGEDGSIGFISSFEMNENEINVTITEWYNEIFFEASDYSAFEGVINAAADFNKIVLVLEPIQ